MPILVSAARDDTGAPPQGSHRRELVLLGVAALGCTAAIAQLALLRELVGIFDGNELTLGASLGSWLLLTAAGTWLGDSRRHRRAHPLRWFAVGLALLSVLPIAQVLAARGLRGPVFGPGAAIDPFAMAVGSLVALAPFCLGSGALLTLAVQTLKRDGDGAALSRVYVADTAGSIAGALGFTFGLGPYLDQAALLAVNALFAAGVAIHLLRRRGARGLAWTVAAGATLVVAGVLAGRLDDRSTRWQYPGDVVSRAVSPYGRVVATRRSGQLTFYENGVPIGFTDDRAAKEETVHYALVQRPRAASVLVIGGSVAGVPEEVLRYPSVRRVTCVELNPALIGAERRLFPSRFAHDRVRFIVDDGRRYLRRTTEKFDAILVALPDPTTFQLNRFFTDSFLAEAKQALTPGGLVGFGLGHYENYVSTELRDLLACGRTTAAAIFAHVMLVPGGRVYFVASDGPLRRDLAAALGEQHVTATLVNEHYLAAMLTPDRLADVDGAAAAAGRTNTDFRPILYGLRLRYWLAQFTLPVGGAGIAAGLVLAAWALRMSAGSRLVAAGGFAASSLELAVLVAVQIYYGCLYQQIGLVVAIFMAGLCAGARYATRVAPEHPQRTLRALALLLAAIAAGFAFVLPRIGSLDRFVGNSVGGMAVLLLLTLVTAVAVGAQFAVAAQSASPQARHVAPRLFSADLVGAAIGAFLVGTLVLPWWGLVGTCALTAALNAGAALLSWRSPRSP